MLPMTFLLGVVAPIPVMAVCYCLYFYFRSRKRLCAKIAVKCGATSMCVLTALAGLLTTGQDAATSLLLWGIIFCMLGDGLLEVHFLTGMAAFGTGHVLLIAWIAGLYVSADAPAAATAVLCAVLYIAALLMFRSQLRTLGKRLPAFLLYPLVLMGMASMAIMLPARFGIRALPLALGGALFAISDLLVAKGVFFGISPALDRFALAIYYIAVDCLALSAWLL